MNFGRLMMTLLRGLVRRVDWPSAGAPKPKGRTHRVGRQTDTFRAAKRAARTVNRINR